MKENEREPKKYIPIVEQRGITGTNLIKTHCISCVLCCGDVWFERVGDSDVFMCARQNLSTKLSLSNKSRRNYDR